MKSLEQTIRKTLWSAIACIAIVAPNAQAQVTPSGGLTDRPIIQGSEVSISWTRHVDAPSVDIHLWNAATSERIEVARGISAVLGEFQWHVPMNVVNGTRYRFVVTPTHEPYRRLMSASWVTVGPQSIHKRADELVSHTHEFDAAQGQITIAPQPSRGVVRIRFESDFHLIRVVSLDGATVLERILCDGEHTVDIDVQHLTSGFYTVVLSSDYGRCISAPLHIMS